MKTGSQRGAFAGMAQIVRFNWPKYGVGLAVAAGMLSLAGQERWAPWIRLGLVLGGGLALWWTFASLAVSHWVYDRSKLCGWEWLRAELPRVPDRWLNLHAGLDESTLTLKRLWPGAEGEVADIFAPAAMGEPSIRRARTEQGRVGRTVDFWALPFADGTFDTAFLIFAVHELRAPADRREFLHELRRVMKRDGQAVLVEHLRDPANFAAFGPGFLHFHSGRTWRKDLAAGGLGISRTFAITPFVCVFLLHPTP